MDASNGDFIGSDYVFVGQDNDKTFRLESFNSSGDILLKESNTNTLRLSGGNATFAGDVSIPVAKKLYFGGGNHTYIGEDIDDRLRFFTGGTEFMRFTEDTADMINFYKDVTVSGSTNVDAITASQFNVRDLGNYITFYGNDDANHSISSRDLSGAAQDDLRFNSYGAMIFNLDSNNNNGTGADFVIGRHGGSGQISSTLFTLSGETGNATFEGDITLKQYGYINFGSSSSNQLQLYNSLSGATLKQYGSGDLHLHSVSNSITFQAGVSGLNTNYGLKVVGESIHTPVLYDLANTSYYLDPANSNTSLSAAGDAQIGGGVRVGGSSGQRIYSSNFSSLTTTGVAVAGLTSGSNGSSASFVFETAGGGSGGYQRVVFSCINVSGTWTVSEDINEGGDRFDIVSSGNGSTVTFTFKARTSTQSYSPKVNIKAFGQGINETYF
jgi:hypothetical protein